MEVEKEGDREDPIQGDHAEINDNQGIKLIITYAALQMHQARLKEKCYAPKSTSCSEVIK